jgi:dynein heavy chain
MYGGHITDFFDRRINNTYLSVVFNENLLLKKELLTPKLLSPDASLWEYDNYSKFIATSLPMESPVMYGLHPNAEIGFLFFKFYLFLQLILFINLLKFCYSKKI